jgi:hypothetical protein
MPSPVNAAVRPVLRVCASKNVASNLSAALQ